MKLRKCLNHQEAKYTLKIICLECNQQTKDAHYKFLRLKNVNAPRENYEESE